MANAIHKGTELNNVKETWEQNEKNRQHRGFDADDQTAIPEDLKQVVKEEAAEYDNTHNDRSTADSERASVKEEKL